MSWQPIKTAPRDGTPILVCDARTGSMRWAVWAARDIIGPPFPLNWRDGTIEARGEIVGVVPTHWMPLPEPPRIGE